MMVADETDWVELLLGPAWEALLVILLAAIALAIILRQPRWLRSLAANAGISRLSLLGVEVELEAAFKLRGLDAPDADALRGFSVLGARLEPVVRSRGVLWIDDKPEGNRHEAGLLRRLGVQVEQVRCTQRAIPRLREPSMSIDLVIANWTRPDDHVATGVDVVAALRTAGYHVPVLFYVGDASPERKAAAAAAGAVGVTAVPDEMLKLALVELATASA
jgi:CheY-like chemotaxis protein